MNHSSLTIFARPRHGDCPTIPRYIDCYDRAVAILTRHSDLIRRSWDEHDAEPDELAGFSLRYMRERKLTEYCHCLFDHVSPSRKYNCGDGIGCLTQIRSRVFAKASDSALTEAIKGDSRLPCYPQDITIDHLPVCAGYQRRADIVLNRTPPPMRIGG